MKLVVFDLDGTLTRTNDVDGECFVRAFMETLQLAELNQDWDSYEQVSDEGVTRQIFVERFGRHPHSMKPVESSIGFWTYSMQAIAQTHPPSRKFPEPLGSFGEFDRTRIGPLPLQPAPGADRPSSRFSARLCRSQISRPPLRRMGPLARPLSRLQLSAPANSIGRKSSKESRRLAMRFGT